MQAFVTWKLLSDKLPLISVRYGIALHVVSLCGAAQNFRYFLHSPHTHTHTHTHTQSAVRQVHVSFRKTQESYLKTYRTQLSILFLHFLNLFNEYQNRENEILFLRQMWKCVHSVKIILFMNVFEGMPGNRLPRVMKHFSPIGRRNHGRTLKRFLNTWDRNGSTSGPMPWQIYDDDDLWAWCLGLFLSEAYLWLISNNKLFIT